MVVQHVVIHHDWRIPKRWVVHITRQSDDACVSPSPIAVGPLVASRGADLVTVTSSHHAPRHARRERQPEVCRRLPLIVPHDTCGIKTRLLIGELPGAAAESGRGSVVLRDISVVGELPARVVHLGGVLEDRHAESVDAVPHLEVRSPHAA